MTLPYHILPDFKVFLIKNAPITVINYHHHNANQISFPPQPSSPPNKTLPFLNPTPLMRIPLVFLKIIPLMSLLLFLKETPLSTIALSLVEPIDESFFSSRPASD